MPIFKPPLFRLLFLPILLAALCMGLFCCDNVGQTSAALSESSSASALPVEEESVAFRLNQQGDSALETAQYQLAIALYQQSMDSAAAQADSFPYYDSKLDLAHVHDRLSEFSKAIEIAEPVVEAYIRSGDSTRIGRAYAALAGFYGKAGFTEKSLDASRKGFDILKQDTSLIHRCAAYNQMAFTYSDEGLWNKALPLLDTAFQLMMASGQHNQAPGMRLNIGNCHRNLGNWAEARRYIEASAAEADSLGQVHVLARALERLSQIAEATGDLSKALQLFRRAKDIRDSIFTEEKNKNIAALRVQFETREKEQEIALLKAQEKTQITQRNLLLVGLFFVILLLALGVQIQRARLRNTRQLLEHKQRELSDYVQLLLEKNAQLTDFEQKPERPSKSPDNPSNSSTEDDTAESLYNSRILTDKDWESFKTRFEQIHPGFIQRLRAQFPDLSGAEERLFLLIKINLNGQEIASILGIALNGVKKSRQRLRKRLALAPDVELEEFVHGFPQRD